jgi:CheY-like chemotaxis protein
MAHVLLIDDDIDLVTANKLALENGGHAVSAAYSAAEGLEAVARLRPELVVLDVMMESFYAGFDLARRLHQEHPKLPMIMLTGVDEYMDDALRASQDHDGVWMPVHRFMEKPVSGAVLLQEVEHLLHEVHG